MGDSPPRKGITLNVQDIIHPGDPDWVGPMLRNARRKRVPSTAHSRKRSGKALSLGRPNVETRSQTKAALPHLERSPSSAKLSGQATEQVATANNNTVDNSLPGSTHATTGQGHATPRRMDAAGSHAPHGGPMGITAPASGSGSRPDIQGQPSDPLLPASSPDHPPTAGATRHRTATITYATATDLENEQDDPGHVSMEGTGHNKMNGHITGVYVDELDMKHRDWRRGWSTVEPRRRHRSHRHRSDL